MAYPVVSVTYPTKIGLNGRLATEDLVATVSGGLLHRQAARSWNALVAAAKNAGYNLTYTYGGMYRSYESQVTLFLSRYQLTYIEYKPGVVKTKMYNGRVYYQRPNTAEAASPGTSNHGYGLAIDTALGTSPSNAVYIGAALPWLMLNAHKFGFSWELQSEPWHLRLVTGDKIPQAVLDYEASLLPPPVVEPVVLPPVPPDLDLETEMPVIVTSSGGADAVVTFGGERIRMYGLDAPSKSTLVKLGVKSVPLTDAEYYGFANWTLAMLNQDVDLERSYDQS